MSERSINTQEKIVQEFRSKVKFEQLNHRSKVPLISRPKT